MAIKEVFLNHKGGRYIYRLDNDKISRICNNQFTSLASYLNFVAENCPNHFFNIGPRSSCLKFRLVDDIKVMENNEVSSLANYGLEINKERFLDTHSMVQVFMLEHDKATIAMEVPIWLMPNELANYKIILKSSDVLTGHIDILRIFDDKIWIWDYKPNANKEAYAATQIFFYAYMLSKRTGISLNKFRCGYFDKSVSFIFKPEETCLQKLNKQSTLNV